MAARRKKEEKEQFFRDLARLDDYIDEDDGLFEQTPSFPQRTPALVQRGAPPVMSTSPATIVISSDESGNSQDPPNDNIIHTSRFNTTGHNALKRKRPSPRGLSVPAETRVTTEPEPLRPSSSPIPTTKGKIPTASSLRRTRSDQGPTVPKLRKRDKKLEQIPTEQQIFHGLTLCI